MERVFVIEVRMEGVEPTRLAALDPKSSASANFATSAYFITQKIKTNLLFVGCKCKGFY